MFKTPILFNIFNRPDCTQIVFNEIKKQKPEYLFVHADGPRPDVREDLVKCEESRKIILDQTDWDCELKTLFSEVNLGCGKGPVEGITWFFNHVDEGIVLEDDMLPDPIFFNYCECLLERYRNNDNIYIISGGNIFKSYSKEDSYYFSRLNSMWGWATWSRVWKKYEYDVICNKTELAKNLKSLHLKRKYVKLITDFYSKLLTIENKSYWDFQVDYMTFMNKAINIMPNSHLVGNIGFTKDGTHTKTYNPMCETDINYSRFSPLMHPKQIIIAEACDKITLKKTYYISLIRMIRGKIKRAMKKVFNKKTK